MRARIALVSIVSFLMILSVAARGADEQELAARVDALEKDKLPQGTLVFFLLPQCPPGWDEYTQGQGRYFVAVPAGGELGKLVGQPLANGENRPTGDHTHSITVVGSPSKARVQAGGAGGNFATDPGPPTTLRTQGVDGGVPPGTNAPYVQVRACVKK